MRHVLALMLVLLALPALAQRTYSGDEAAALRCSNMLAFTAVALGAADKITEAEKNAMLAIAAGILDRHVSGTRAQKLAALEE